MNQDLPICVMPISYPVSIECQNPSNEGASQASYKTPPPDSEKPRTTEVQQSKDLNSTSPNEEEIPKSFRKRNVCKSILRRICRTIKNDRSSILKALKEADCKEQAVDKTIIDLITFSEAKWQKEVCEHAHLIINEMLEKRDIYIFLLKETTSKMLEEWSKGCSGKISEKNLTLYKTICNFYYEKAMEVIQKHDKPI